MSTYLQGVTDNGFNIIQYSPNLPLLAKALDKATVRYDTNFNKLATGYSNIDDATITNDGRRDQRTEYLNGIKDQIKNISTKDLGIQANVNQAESLYAPFWEDKAMLTDIAWTKQQSTALSKQKALVGTDEYSQEAIVVMEDAINKIKKADVNDINIYSKVSPIEYTPFKYTIKAFMEWAKKNDYHQIKSASFEGGRVWEKTNGEGTRSTFSQLFKSWTGDAADAQYIMLGKYKVIQAVRRIQNDAVTSGSPIPSDDDALQLIPDTYAFDLKKTYKDNSDLLQKDNTEMQLLFDKEGLKAPGVRSVSHMKELQDLMDSNRDKIKKYTVEFEGLNAPGSEAFLELKKNILANPNLYFANIASMQLQSEAGTALASIQSSSVKEDAAYWHNVTAENLKVQNAISNRFKEWEMNNATKKLNYDLLNPPSTTTNPTTTNPNTPGGVGGSETSVNKYAQTNQNKVDSEYDYFKSYVSSKSTEALSVIHELLLTNNTPFMTKIAGFDNINDLFLNMNHELDGKDKSHPDVVRHTNAKNAIIANLAGTEGPLTKDSPPRLVLDAIINKYDKLISPLITQYSEDVTKGTYRKEIGEQVKQETSLHSALMDAKTQMNGIHKLEIKRDAFFKKFIESDENRAKYQHLLYQDKNKVWHMQTAENLQKQFGEYVDPYTRKRAKVPLQVFKDFLNGTLRYDMIHWNIHNVRPAPDAGFWARVWNKIAGWSGTAHDERAIMVNDVQVDLQKMFQSQRMSKKYDGNVPNVSDMKAAHDEVNEIFMNFKKDALTPDENKFFKESGAQGTVISYTSVGDLTKPSFADNLHRSIINTPGAILKVDDEPNILNIPTTASSDYRTAMIKILSTITSGNKNNGINLYPQGYDDSNTRAVGFLYSLDSLQALGLPKESIEALQAGGYDGKIVVGINDASIIKGFPSAGETRAYHDFYLNTNQSGVKNTSIEEQLGVKYSFKRSSSGQTYYKIGVRTLVAKDPTDPKAGYTVEWRNFDYTNHQNGELMYSDSDSGFSELPSTTILSELLSDIKRGVFMNVSNLIINPLVTANGTPEVTPQSLEEQKIFDAIIKINNQNK